MDTGAFTGCKPSGAHWDHRAEARDTAGAPGGFQILGMLLARFPGEDQQQSSFDEVDYKVASTKRVVPVSKS